MTVVRPEDFLVLRLEFTDVDLTSGASPTVGGAANALLVVHFQPQHAAEQAFWEQGTANESDEEKAAREKDTPPAPAPPGVTENLGIGGTIGSRLAGPSRLAFRIPAGTTFPLTLESVLDALTRLPLNVTAVARYERNPGCARVPVWLLPLFGQPSPPKISPPTRFETAIEAPYRLFLSPDDRGSWTHASKPVEHMGSTELWHTRLGSHRPGGDPRVRAVWSRDYRETTLQPHQLEPFRSALDERDRNEIVHLTANYYLENFQPDPVRTERLMLTTLGAWLDLEGNWEPPPFPPDRHLTVEQWRHVATMGRDHYVRVVYGGFLLPFGHRASLVKITERKFVKPLEPPLPGWVAYTLQRMYIVVKEEERNYTPRDMPLRRVRIKTKFTPDLWKPDDSDVVVPPPLLQDAFWPCLAKDVPFQFHCVGTDWEPRDVEFPASMLFVTLDTDANDAFITAAIAEYNSKLLWRTYPFAGQKVAFAQPTLPLDTSLETESITFKAEKEGAPAPHFRPLMDGGKSVIPAVKELTNSRIASTIKLTDGFKSGAGNAGDVFVTVSNDTPVNFDPQTSGGLTTPNIKVKGISRAIGPTGDDAMITGSFNPTAVFQDIKIFGHLDLNTILHGVAAGTNLALEKNVPKLITVREGNVVKTTYLFRADHDHLTDGTIFKRSKTTPANLQLEAIAEAPVGGTPTFRVEGRLDNFTLSLVPLPEMDLVDLEFRQVKFTARSGQKLDTSVDLGGITFKGLLEFVNELRTYIPMDGFSDPPAVQLVTTPDPGVIVGFSMGLPTIGVGIMTMQNIALSASFFLPFNTKPMNFRFAFCERHQPFTLTVSLFGGGGFFGICIGLKGVTYIEASLEFGASIALNLGVASGQASIMAGFYFRIGEDNLCILTGYFRASGSLSVLGIITVSVEFYLGLTYASKNANPHGGTLWGQARLTVKIKIVFFSISVGISLEREFAGSDPSFRQLMPFDVWDDYCDAFDPAYALGEEA